MKEKIYVALDIGETTIKALAMNYYNSKLTVIASTKVKTSGITNGDISNVNDLSISIKEALSNLANQDDTIPLDKILLVLPSSKIKVYRKKASLEIAARDHIITTKDLRELRISFAKSDISNDEIIVNLTPICYRIDGGEPLYKDISGMSATRVELEANVITLPSFVARSYVDIIQNMGYEILDAVVSPLALSSILVTNDATTNGNVIVDFGGKNTLLSYFQSGTLVGTSLIKFGSNLITSEISKVFDLNYDTCDKLKKEFGNANAQMSEQIIVYSDEARGLYISEQSLTDVVTKRLEEFYVELIKQSSTLTKNIMYPMTLIGGGSHLNSLDEQMSNRLNRKVKTYMSSFVGARSNDYLPCIGIIHYYINTHR